MKAKAIATAAILSTILATISNSMAEEAQTAAQQPAEPAATLAPATNAVLAPAAPKPRAISEAERQKLRELSDALNQLSSSFNQYAYSSLDQKEFATVIDIFSKLAFQAKAFQAKTADEKDLNAIAALATRCRNASETLNYIANQNSGLFEAGRRFPFCQGSQQLADWNASACERKAKALEIMASGKQMPQEMRDGRHYQQQELYRSLLEVLDAKAAVDAGLESNNMRIPLNSQFRAKFAAFCDGALKAYDDALADAKKNGWQNWQNAPGVRRARTAFQLWRNVFQCEECIANATRYYQSPEVEELRSLYLSLCSCEMESNLSALALLENTKDQNVDSGAEFMRLAKEREKNMLIRNSAQNALSQLNSIFRERGSNAQNNLAALAKTEYPGKVAALKAEISKKTVEAIEAAKDQNRDKMESVLRDLRRISEPMRDLNEEMSLEASYQDAIKKAGGLDKIQPNVRKLIETAHDACMEALRQRIAFRQEQRDLEECANIINQKRNEMWRNNPDNVYYNLRNVFDNVVNSMNRPEGMAPAAQENLDARVKEIMAKYMPKKPEAPVEKVTEKKDDKDSGCLYWLLFWR